MTGLNQTALGACSPEAVSVEVERVRGVLRAMVGF
jgi:hypothetical protein